MACFHAKLPDGRTLVSCHTLNAVLILNEKGFAVGRVGVNFSRPEGIAVNSKGDVLIADRYHHSIHVLDKALQHKRSIVTDHQLPGRLDQPTGIAISASDDRIWVADSENHRVLVLASNGEYLATLGSGRGMAPGQLYYPSSVALYNHPLHGELVIVSEWARVQVFRSAGDVFAIFGGVQQAHYATVDAQGAVYVTEQATHRIKRFSIDGDPSGSVEESSRKRKHHTASE